MASNRELSIKITVNAAAAKTALNKLKADLNGIQQVTTKAANAQKKSAEDVANAQSKAAEKAAKAKERFLRDDATRAMKARAAEVKADAAAEKAKQSTFAKRIANYGKEQQAGNAAAVAASARSERVARADAAAADRQQRTAATTAAKQVREAEKAAAAQVRAQEKIARETQRAAAASARAQQKSMKDIKRAYNDALRVQQQYVENIQQQIDTNRRNAYSFTIMGMQIKQFGQSITNAMGSSVDALKDFDWNMRRAAISMDITADGAVGFENLTTAIQKTAIETKLFKPDEVALGLYYWGSTTGQVVDSMSDLEAVTSDIVPVMKAAAITGLDLETALKGVYGIEQQFNMGMEETARVANILYAATMKTALEFEDLLSSFKMVGPVAASLGVTFEEVATLLSVIGDAGIRGSMAGRALRMFFIRLAKDTSATTKQLDLQAEAVYGLGTTWDELVFPHGEFVGMQGALDAMTNLTKGLNNQQRLALLGSAATMNEIGPLIKLVDANTASQEKYGQGIIATYNAQKNFADSQDSIARGWEVMGKSAKATFQELSNKIAPLLLRTGQAIVDAFTPIAKVIGDIALSINEWAKNNQTLFAGIVALIGLTGGLATLAGTFLLVFGAIKLLAGSVIPEMSLFLRANTTATAAATAANEAYAASLVELGVAQKLSTGGVIVPKGVAAAPFKSPKTLGMAALVKAALGIQGSFTKAALSIGKFGVQLVTKIPILAAIGATIAFVVQFVRGLIQGFGATAKATDKAGDSFKGIKDVIGSVVKVIVEFVKGVMNGLQYIGVIVGWLLGQFTNAIGGVLDFVGSLDAVKVVAEAVAGFVQGIADAIGWLGDQLEKFNLEAEKTLGNGSGLTEEQKRINEMYAKSYKSRQDAAAEADKVLAEQQAAADEVELQKLAQALEDQAQATKEHAAAMEEAAMLGIYIPTTLVVDKLSDYVEEAGRMIPQAFASGMIGSEEQLFTLFDSTMDLVTAGMAKGGKVGKGAAKAGRDMVTEFYTNAKDQVDPMVTSLVSFMNTALSSNAENVRQMGTDVMGWLMGDMENYGADAAPRAMEVVLGEIKSMLDSGDKDLIKRGRGLMASLVSGFAQQEGLSPTVAANLNAMVDLMNQGDAAAAAAGWNLVTSWLNGQVKSFDSGVTAIKNRIAAIKGLMGVYIQQYGGAGLRMINAEAAKWEKLLSTAQSIKAVGKIKPVGVGGGSSSKKSGGGSSKSGGSEKNPLQEALTVAQNGVDLAEALKKLEGVNLRKLVQSAMGGVASAMKLATTITYKYAKGVSKKTLQKVADFSSAVGALAEAISASIDSFDKLRGYKNLNNNQFKIVIADIHAAITFMSKEAKKYKGSTLGNVQVFAEVAATVANTYGSVAESLTKTKGYKNIANSTFTAIALDTVAAVKEMIKASAGMKQSAVTAAADFSEGAGTIIDTIGSAFDTFMKLNDYVKPLPGILEGIVDTTIIAVQLMIVAMGKFSLSEEQMAKVKAFSEMTSAVTGAISDTYDAFVKTIQFVDQFREVINFNTVFGWIRLAVAEFQALSGGISDETITKIKNLGDAATSIAGAIEAFFNIGKNASQDPDSLGTLVQKALDEIIATVATFVVQFGDQGAALVDNFILGMRSRYTALSAAVIEMQTILGGASSPVSVNVTGNNPTLTIVHIVKDPDGALANANTTQVAQMLSGSTFINNLTAAARTQ